MALVRIGYVVAVRPRSASVRAPRGTRLLGLLTAVPLALLCVLLAAPATLDAAGEGTRVAMSGMTGIPAMSVDASAGSVSAGAGPSQWMTGCQECVQDVSRTCMVALAVVGLTLLALLSQTLRDTFLGEAPRRSERRGMAWSRGADVLAAPSPYVLCVMRT